MGLFAFIAVGLVVGFGTRAVAPGERTKLLSIALFGGAGAFVGALIGALYYGKRVFELHSDIVLAGILTTFTLLFLAGVGARSRRRRATF